MAASETIVSDSSGDRAPAFTALYRKHYNAVRRFASWRCEPADLDDVVADVFLVAWRRFDELDTSWVRAWLFGTVKKVLSDHRRSRAQRARYVDHLVALRPAEHTNLDTGDLSVEDLDVLKAGLRKVSEEDQEVLVLSAWYEMTAAEIAVAVSITKNNATVRLHRARTRFRTAIAEMERDAS